MKASLVVSSVFKVLFGLAATSGYVKKPESDFFAMGRKGCTMSAWSRQAEMGILLGPDPSCGTRLVRPGGEKVGRKPLHAPRRTVAQRGAELERTEKGRAV